MLENAERERLGNVGQPDKPLIRLRVSPILFYFFFWVASILDKLNFIDFSEDSIAEFISLFRTFAQMILLRGMCFSPSIILPSTLT